MTSEFLLGIAIVWLLCGVVIAFVMRRRGHDFFVWLALGSVLGPLAVPLAVDRARHELDYPGSSVVHPHPGGFDLLVGLDGSDESSSAMGAALELLGPSVTSVTLTTVLDFEARGTRGGEEDRNAAAEMLEAAARSVQHEQVETEILYGTPHEAISRYATENGIEMIVVGARGHGAAEALFGSVTSRLVGGSDVPVLVGGKPAPVPLPRMRPD